MTMAGLKLWAAIAGLVMIMAAVIVTAWRAYLIEAERGRAAIEAARDFRETTERIGGADVGTGNSDDDLGWLERRLRERAGGQR